MGKEKNSRFRGISFEISSYNIDTEEVVNRYAEIDVFSQGRLDGRKSNFTARNMGKNDIWIAAMASVLDAMLLRTDKFARRIFVGCQN